MELIGKGNTAEVFDMGDGKILKLFIAGYPMGNAVVFELRRFYAV